MPSFIKLFARPYKYLDKLAPLSPPLPYFPLPISSPLSISSPLLSSSLHLPIIPSYPSTCQSPPPHPPPSSPSLNSSFANPYLRSTAPFYAPPLLYPLRHPPPRLRPHPPPPPRPHPRFPLRPRPHPRPGLGPGQDLNRQHPAKKSAATPARNSSDIDIWIRETQRRGGKLGIWWGLGGRIWGG